MCENVDGKPLKRRKSLPGVNISKLLPLQALQTGDKLEPKVKSRLLTPCGFKSSEDNKPRIRYERYLEIADKEKLRSIQICPLQPISAPPENKEEAERKLQRRPTLHGAAAARANLLRGHLSSSNYKAPVFLETKCALDYKELQVQDGSKRNLAMVLQESKNRVNAIKAGAAYMTSYKKLARDKEHQKQKFMEEHKNDMRLQQLTTKEIDYLVAQDVEEISLEPVEASSIHIEGSMNEDPNLTSVSFCRTAQLLNFKKTLKQTNMYKKLQAIYDMLCCLYNIPTKTLKNKTPLKLSYIYRLRKDPFVQLNNSIPTKPIGNTDKLQKRKTKFVLSGSVHQVNSEKSLSESQGEDNVSEAANVNQGITQQKNQNSIRSLKPKQMTDEIKDTNINNANNALKFLQRSYQTPVEGAREGQVLDSIFETVIKKNIPDSTIGRSTKNTWDDLINYRIKFKKLPPWQDDVEERVRSRHEKREERDFYKHHQDEVLSSIRYSYFQLKKRLMRKQRKDLEKFERERLLKFKYNMKATSKVKRFFHEEMSKLKAVERRAARDPSLITEKVCPWYRKLVQDVNVNECINHPLVADCLKKIQPFILEEIHKITQVKDKLALLTISLPMHEILTPNVQSGIVFILTEILEKAEDLFVEWMKYRELYVIAKGSH